MLFLESKSIKNDIKTILTENNFIDMTKIQALTIKESNKDLIVQAPTGSGKTLCYTIPVANLLINQNMKGIRAIIIVPTRELCIQIEEVLRMFKVKSEIFIGGMNSKDKTETIEKHHDDLAVDSTSTYNLNNIISDDTNVLVGTPGRLWFLVKSNPSVFSKVKFLILDEADKLLSQGFDNQIKTISGLIPKKNRITHFYTATINESVQALGKQMINYKEIISEEIIPQKLNITYTQVAAKDKLNMCLKLSENNERTIIFFSTCAQVDFYYYICSRMQEKNPINKTLIKLHGKMNQEDRNDIFKEIKTTGSYILFTTDVSARGVDFDTVDLVIHFDVPKDPSNIIHRSGRSGRNGIEGKSIILLMENESAYPEYLRLKIKDIEIERSDLFVEVPENIADWKDLMRGEEKQDGNEEVKSHGVDLATRAFVSYIRAYKEHIVNFILNVKHLDLEDLKEAFLLEKIPRMREMDKEKKFRKKKKNTGGK